MVKNQAVYDQLKKLGINPKSWGASAISELPHILMPHESIIALVNGWYVNGFATLVATSERLLLIDKKWLHLTIEDVRYDMISEVDFNAQLMDATIHVNTVNKVLRFTSMRQRRLRELTHHIQQKVMEGRNQHNFSWQQFEPTPVAAPTPQFQPATTGPTASLPLVSPALSAMRRPAPSNHYAKVSLTTKRNFLPKVPRRLRPHADPTIY